jgi:hypothetical protein
MAINFRIINRGVFSANVLNEAVKDNSEKPRALKDNLILTTVKPIKAEISPTASASAFVPQARSSPFIKAEQVKLFDPVMALNISTIVFPTVGVPREKLVVPISPSADVTDEMLFEDPADQGKKFYLPRYRVSEQNVSGSQQFKVSLEKAENAWNLMIYLNKYPAPKIEIESRGASELAHEVAVLLRYHIKGSNGALKELSFQEENIEQGIKAILNLDSLTERDEVYRALIEGDYQSELIIRRVFKVAIPVGVSSGGDVRIPRPRLKLNRSKITPVGVLDKSDSSAIISSGNATIRGTWTFSFETGKEGGQNDDVWWEQHTDTLRSIVLRGQAKITNLGVVDFDSISLPQLKSMAYSTDPINGNADASNKLVNGDVFAVVTNSGNYAKVQVMQYGYNLGIRWVTYAFSAQDTGTPIFREVIRALDDVPEPHPFNFPPDLHPYIFHDITPSTPEGSGLIHIHVDSSSYYQDAAQPYIFYYLPDSFKIARKPEALHTPIMSVEFDLEDSVNLAYFAMPYTDTGRLSNALEKLRQYPSFLAAKLPQGIDSPLLQPLQIDPNKIKFYLGMPGQEGSSGPFQERSEEVLINIITGITDELELNLEGFQEIFNSIFSGPTLIFQGKVEVEVYTGKTESIPFIAKMNDMAGPILDYKEEQDNASGGVTATFVNAIESPVRINSLGAKIIRGNSSSRAEIREMSLPFQLKPGESSQFVVAPLEPLSEDSQPHAVFDPFNLDVLPDSGAIWDAIVEKRVPSKPREITIRTPVFDDSGLSENLLEFIVEFKSGITVELNRDQKTVKIALRLTPESFKNMVLGIPDQSMYVYHVTAVSKDNKLTRSPDRILEGDTIIVTGVN